MKLLYSLLASLLYVVPALCQNAAAINEEVSLTQMMSGESFYKYKRFNIGQVLFKNGGRSSARLNYNLLLGEIHYVIPKGDTLSLANEDSLKYVVIVKDTFYYDQGYLFLIGGDDLVKVGVSQRLKIGNKQYVGAYGERLPDNANANYSSLNLFHQFSKLSPKQLGELKLENKFFVADQSNNFIALNKKNLLKRYKDKQDELDGYLRKASTDFNKKDDVLNLLSFLQKLD